MSDFDTIHSIYETQAPEAMDRVISDRAENPSDEIGTIRRFLSWADSAQEREAKRMTNAELISKFVEYSSGLGYGDPRFALLTESGTVTKPVAAALAKVRQGQIHAALEPFPASGELRTVAEPKKQTAPKKKKKKKKGKSSE